MIVFLLLPAIPLIFTLINSLTIRVVRAQDSKLVESSVAILIPMRNEEFNVGDVVASALASMHLQTAEIVALDDQSTDATLELLKNFPQVKTIAGTDLPDGWLGKNFACHQLVAHSSGDYLVFVDADVRLSPRAISAAIADMNFYKWDFISPYPGQIALTFLERLIQPLLQWSWLSSVPLRFAERGHFASMIIANGQFMIVKRDAYLKAGGHKAIRHEVLDDLELARLLVRNGFKGGVAEGSEIAVCRMYDNPKDLVSGYTKSLWRAFGTPIGAVISVIFLLSTGVFPFFLAISGYRTAWLGYFLIVLSRYVAAIRTRSTPSTALLHPLAILTLVFLIGKSWYQKQRGQLIWRGRSVS